MSRRGAFSPPRHRKAKSLWWLGGARRMPRALGRALVGLAGSKHAVPSQVIALSAALVTAGAVGAPKAQPLHHAGPVGAADLQETLDTLVVSPRPDGGAAPPDAVQVQPAPLPAGPPPKVRLPAAAEKALARIRHCESGSDYRARSASGRYGGAYQMDRQTFASVGGSGDPAAASPAEQDHRARLLYRQRGGRPWPVCAVPS